MNHTIEIPQDLVNELQTCAARAFVGAMNLHAKSYQTGYDDAVTYVAKLLIANLKEKEQTNGI